MYHLELITWILIVVIGLISYKGFKDYGFLNKYSFRIDEILVQKEYKRLITSGFLHANWTHLIFNLITLYIFSSSLELQLGMGPILVLYFASLLGGSLLALFIHRNHGDYSGIGASGAISGLVFASIALFPDIRIGLILIPVSFPAWLFGIAYVVYSMYGIKTQGDNIGHEAHLGGGLTGLIIAIILNPGILAINYLPIMLILIPSIIFLFIIFYANTLLLRTDTFSEKKEFLTIEDKYNRAKVENQKELDKLLEKIHHNGYDSLSDREKERLRELSE